MGPKARFWTLLSGFARRHGLGKPFKQVVAVHRARRGLWVVLHGVDRLALDLDPTVGPVKERDMGFHNPFWQALRIHRKSVVHRRDFHLTGVFVFHRVVGAVVSVIHFDGLGAQGQSQHLVTKANSKNRDVFGQDLFDHRDGIDARCGRIARTV